MAVIYISLIVIAVVLIVIVVTVTVSAKKMKEEQVLEQYFQDLRFIDNALQVRLNASIYDVRKLKELYDTIGVDNIPLGNQLNTLLASFTLNCGLAFNFILAQNPKVATYGIDNQDKISILFLCIALLCFKQDANNFENKSLMILNLLKCDLLKCDIKLKFITNKQLSMYDMLLLAIDCKKLANNLVSRYKRYLDLKYDMLYYFIQNKAFNANEHGLSFRTPLVSTLARIMTADNIEFGYAKQLVLDLLSLPQVDVNEECKGEYALILALDIGDLDIIEKMFEKDNLNLNVTNFWGKTPLEIARSKQYDYVEKLILDYQKRETNV